MEFYWIGKGKYKTENLEKHLGRKMENSRPKVDSLRIFWALKLDNTNLWSRDALRIIGCWEIEMVLDKNWKLQTKKT